MTDRLHHIKMKAGRGGHSQNRYLEVDWYDVNWLIAEAERAAVAEASLADALATVAAQAAVIERVKALAENDLRSGFLIEGEGSGASRRYGGWIESDDICAALAGPDGGEAK